MRRCCEDTERQAIVVVTNQKGELSGILRQVKEKFGCGPKSITRKSMRASASKLLPVVPTRFIKPGGGVGRPSFGRWKAVFVLPEKEAAGLCDFVVGITNEELQSWARGDDLTEKLIKRCSEEAFNTNVSTEFKANKDQKQALAIAFTTLKAACGVDTDKPMTSKEIVAMGTKKESTKRGRDMQTLIKIQEQTEYLRALLEQAAGQSLEELRNNVIDLVTLGQAAGGMEEAEADKLRSQAKGADVDQLIEMWTHLTIRFPFIAQTTGPTGSELEQFVSPIRDMDGGPAGVGG